MATGSQGPVGEHLSEGVERVDAPFGGGGQVGVDDREVGESQVLPHPLPVAWRGGRKFRTDLVQPLVQLIVSS